MSTSTVKFLCIEHWKIDLETGEMINVHVLDDEMRETERIDPLGIKLLKILAEHKGELVTKEFLMSKLWPDNVVNEEALPRCISRVRKLLGDQPRNPQFIQTLPKRGYRLIAEAVAWVELPVEGITTKNIGKKHSNRLVYFIGLIVVAILSIYLARTWVVSSKGANTQISSVIQQADVYYHKVTRSDNEMALELYQQAISLSPNSAKAYSGLANAIVQRAIRLPTQSNQSDWQEMSLGKALSDGRLSSKRVEEQLERAFALSQKSIDLAPKQASSYKAMGFVLSAQNKLPLAIDSYQRALLLDANSWDVLINIGDVYEIMGQLTNAISYYKRAFSAMSTNEFAQNTAAKEWRASLGATIGDKYLIQNNLIEAEVWFRHVLTFAPFDEGATSGLSSVLLISGQSQASQRLCMNYMERVGKAVCE